ncbi:hypothetical protein BAUCODRAFT_131489 [Baudoinia panamericana UAMH 10762]|uniref:Major facilitator superfamily (MFS) profile domain-containing protein n=1 Tax=Baudoinia panamericana (strain UAMH 10762) TaxID=717646 RepID=M2N9Z6_BAUPA|nr:uncharacterized protein BAUCODRAFT_131489 [Baudoinia panamericana UAMH 10762]EMC95675.1 hypothetical protein BAUCODRAFT_131489 [Baudoinia panamericana UAMH 10762]
MYLTTMPSNLSTWTSSLKDKPESTALQGPEKAPDPVHSRTEARILPDVGQEQLNDLEKGAAAEPQNGPPPGAFDPRQNPDGGAKAWLCVLGGFCVLFCSFGWINTIGVFQNYYQTHQLAEYSPSTVSWVSSLETFFMFAGGPIIGKLYDNYGPRWLLIVGTFLHVFGLMMTSLATEYYQFILAQGICSPIGASAIFYPAMSTITTWFFQKRGAAFGIMAAGSSLGGVIFPIMVQRLIYEVGFGWSMRIAAFLILSLMIIANLTITSRIPPVKKPWKLVDFLAPLAELPFDLVTLGCFLFFLGMFLPINYIILEATSYGMRESLAQYLPAILNAASLFGRTLPGYFADKLGRFNMMIIMCFFTAILVLAMWIPSTGNAPIIVFSALYGFGSGAFVSLAPSLIAQISDVRQIGVRTGSLFAIIAIAALISNPIGGAILQRWDGKWTGLQAFAGVMTFAGACVLVMARIRLVGWKVTAKF